MNLRLFSALAAFSLSVFAGPKAEVLSPYFSGTGCPKGTVDVSISPNAKQVDLTFTRFLLEAENAVGVSSCSRECETTVRLKVPHGYAVAVKRVRYKGRYDLPYGAQLTFSGTHFFGDDEVTAFSKRYYGRTDGALELCARIPDYSLSWSACGEEAKISARTKVFLQAKGSVRKASFQIGGEPNAGISYELLWRPCQENLD